jgi:hypothetical protein
MSTPVHHAQSSVTNWGGLLEDYLPIHNWFDDTKAYFPNFRHRALKHHSLGIKECVEKFGDYITNSDGKKVPVKLIGEQHIIEDCGFIPSIQDWLCNIKPKEFMYRAKKTFKGERLNRQEKQLEILNKVSQEALDELESKRGKEPDFIKEFFDWVTLVRKKLNKYLN